jgi:hypothetical protein
MGLFHGTPLGDSRQAFSVERQTSAPVSAVFPPLSCTDLTSVRMPTLLIRGERTGPLFHQAIDAARRLFAAGATSRDPGRCALRGVR